MHRFIFFLTLLLGLLPGASRAQDVAGLLPIGAAYKLSADAGTPGVVKLHWVIAKDYYLYRGQMRFAGGNGVTLDEANLPEGKKYRDEYLGDVETYHDRIDASVPYTLAPGTQRIKLSVRYQGCHEVDPKICYPPHTEELDLPLPGAAATSGATSIGGSSGMTESAASNASTPGSESTVSSNGLFAALALALIGGLILNLMPCVLPMLSIKAIGLLESGADAAKARRQALAYTAGVLCSFAAIGLTIVVLRSAGHAFGWGAQLQQPLFIGVLVCVMVAVGLSMSGAFHFGTSFGNAGQSLAARSGIAGDFFTGVLTVAVASPCVAPFMGSALAYAFAAPVLAALPVFVALGFGLALPFLLVAFVPAIGRLLPRPGAWMETLKQALAFPMYLTAVWLAWVLAHQRGADAVGLVLVAVVLLAMTLWWFERSRLRGAPSKALVVVLALLVLVPLYEVKKLPAAAEKATTQAGAVAYTPEKLVELRAANTPVFVDMTADWCITCKANERSVLDTAAFRTLLRRTGAVYMVGDWTDVNATIEAFLQQYRSPGVPLYVVFPRNGHAGKQLPNVLTASIVEKALTEAAM
jgi:thiol:disulfide interchange protein DsbD